VDVIAPKVGKTEDVLMLPADIRPNQMTAIFARASGYLKPLPAGIDIGAHVEAGQVIAEIAAPDVDAQLEQSKAALQQATVASVRAEQEYALNQSTLTRYEEALKNKAVSEQDVEERRTQQSVGQSALMEAKANVVALDAAVKRLVELQGFQKVAAPFSGVLTFRGYDTGALISPGDSTGKELFRLEQSDVLRASANVPQSFATDVKIGQVAEILVRNYPEREFPGTIARSAGSVDPATRTMRVEVDVANKDAVLLPGMYGQIRFHIHRDRPALTLPTSALVFGAEGVRIVVIENGHAKYRTVTLGRDLGVEVEVVAGLAAADAVINNPGPLVDGAAVVVKTK
jgi:RND family efflux transporter MFP subunit